MRRPGLLPEPPTGNLNWRRHFSEFTEDRDWRRGPVEPPLGDRDPRRRAAEPPWGDWNWRRWEDDHPGDRPWTRPDFPRANYPRADYPRPDYPRPDYPRPDYPRPEYPRPEAIRRPSRPDPLQAFILDPDYFSTYEDIDLPVPDSPSTTTATSATTASTPTSNTDSVAHTHWLPILFEKNRSTTRFPTVGQMFVGSIFVQSYHVLT